MCEVCAIFGAGEHWSDFGRVRNEQFPFQDIKFYRAERTRRVELLSRLLSPLGIRCEDWDGEAMMVYAADGRSELAPTLGDIWMIADRFSNLQLDPLSANFVRGLTNG